MSASRSSTSPRMMKFKDEGVDGNVKGVAYLFKKNKIDVLRGRRPHRGARQGRGEGADGKTQTLETKAIVIATGSDVARLPGIDDRREARRLVDRRAGARQGARQAPGDRCRRHRPRTRLGLAAARRAGDGGRISRPHPARHGQRGLPPVPAHPREAGHRVQAVVQGHGDRYVRQDAQGDRRAGGRRRGRDGRGRRGAGRGRPRALHARGSGSKPSASSRTTRAASSSTRITRPMCPASTPSAT